MRGNYFGVLAVVTGIYLLTGCQPQGLGAGAQEIQDVADAKSMDSDQSLTFLTQAKDHESELSPESIPAEKATVRAHLQAWVEGLAAPDLWGGVDPAKDAHTASTNAGAWASAQLAAAGQL